MAQRFGGPHSPDNSRNDSSPSGAGRRVLPTRAEGPARGEWKLTLLFILSLIFPLRAFFGDASWLLQSLGAMGLILAGLALTRQGMRAATAYDARTIARRPAFPRKIIGAILLGAGLGLGAFASGAALPVAGMLAALAAILHLGAFGLDPMADKGMAGVDAFQTDRVANAVEEGERVLAQMRDAILRAGDRAIERRVAEFSQTAEGLFRHVESSPGDLTSVRKYLSVYLQGARDATVKFADHYAATHDQKSRDDYMALLADMQSTFADRSRVLLAAPNTDLDVEISVLRDRLKTET
jgi:hypothetical protein